MQHFRNRAGWLDALWILALALYVLAGMKLVPFHGDESTLVYMGHDYYHQFVDGDLSLVTYDETGRINPALQYLRLLNGTISKYLYGFMAYTGGFSVNDLNEQWDWGAGWDYNEDTDRIPQPEILARTRFISSLQHILAIAVLFGIGRYTFNRPTAYVASFYFTLNPGLLMNGRRAMMEGSHILFMLLFILVALWAIRNRKWWQHILVGICAGLALAAKHPNAFVIVLVYFACGSYYVLNLLWQPSLRKTLSRATVTLILGGLLGIATFIALNPAWWGDPSARLAEILTLRSELLAQQTQDSAFTYQTWEERFGGFFENVFIAPSQYFESQTWDTFDEIQDQIEGYERSGLGGVSIGGSIAGGVIVLLLVVYGFFRLMSDWTVAPEHRWLMVVWIIGIITVTVLFTPLSWQRYYQPVYPVVGLLIGYSVSKLVAMTRIKFQA